MLCGLNVMGINHVLDILNAEPWNAVVTRDGLRVASTLNMLEGCLKVCKLTGEGADVLSEPDTHWFRQQIAKESHNSPESHCREDVQ
jgi:hypothetical protein